ncbi:MAG: hypothetical protein ACXADC_13500 [Candidatus Thorarchaeota archaeon]|jgi:hypothetical protein
MNVNARAKAQNLSILWLVVMLVSVMFTVTPVAAQVGEKIDLILDQDTCENYLGGVWDTDHPSYDATCNIYNQFVVIESIHNLIIPLNIRLRIWLGGEVLVLGSITNYGVIKNEGTIESYTILENQGEITNDGVFQFRGGLDNKQLIFNNEYMDSHGIFDNHGLFENNEQFVNIDILNNYGEIETNDIFINGRSLRNIGSITNNGWLENSYEIINEGNIVNFYIIKNWASITNNEDGILENYFSIENEGTLANYWNVYNFGAITNSYSGAIIYNGGMFQSSDFLQNSGFFENHGTFTNDGTFDNHDNLLNHGIFNNREFGVLDNQILGTFSNLVTGLLDNLGLVNIRSNSYVYNYGVTSSEGIMRIRKGGTLTNSLTFNNHGTLDNQGDLINEEEFWNSGILRNLVDSNISNRRSFTNVGDINNQGNIYNQGTLVNMVNLRNLGKLAISAESTLTNPGTILNDGGTVILGGLLDNLDGVFDNRCGTIVDEGGTVSGNPIADTCAFDWVEQFGTPGWDWARIAVGDTGVYVSATTPGTLTSADGIPLTNSGNRDVYVRKYSFDGQELWTRQFGTVGDDLGTRIKVDGDEVYVLGRTDGVLTSADGVLLTSSGNSDAFIRKYDSSGNEIWTRMFGFPLWDATTDIVFFEFGFFVCGYSGAGSNSISFFSWFDNNGFEQWTRLIEASYVLATSVFMDETGVYVIGNVEELMLSADGMTQSYFGDRDGFIRKYDFGGNEIWTRQFGSIERESSTRITGDGTGVYISGGTSGKLKSADGVILASSGNSDSFLTKYDSEGNELWTRQFGTAGGDRSVSLASVDSSGVYVMGAENLGDSHIYVRRFDTIGDELWKRQFDTHGNELDGEIYVTDHGVYIGGMTTGSYSGETPLGSFDGFVAKLSDGDADGLFDDVDLQPLTPSNEFSDGDVAFPTTGIVQPRDQFVIIRDDPYSSKGVRIKTHPGGGAERAAFRFCGSSTTVFLGPGREVSATCGSITIESITGTVDITFVDDEGRSASGVLEESEVVTFEPETFTLESLEGTPEITFVANDLSEAIVSLTEDNAITYDPVAFEITAALDNPDPVVIVINGEENTIDPGESLEVLSLEDLIGALQDIIDANPNTSLAEEIEDVLSRVQNALDELDKTPPDNLAAIGNIEKAVSDLEAAVRDEILDLDLGKQLLDSFLAIARQIVVNALDHAIAAGGDLDSIDEAVQYLAEGDALWSSGDYKKAVDKFKDALSKAESSL